MTLGQRFRRLLGEGSLDLPALGEGNTAKRFRLLTDFSSQDVSLGRLAEAHVDAVQILREAGRRAEPGVWYGVWAADDPSAKLTLRCRGSSCWLDGTKVFCTGADLVDRALITVRTPESVLIDVAIRSNRERVRSDTSAWISAAFAETSTAIVEFDELQLDGDAIVGAPGWYLDRPGFWNGACAPAACWAGGAQGLIEWALQRTARAAPDTHRDTAAGALSALAFQMSAVLDHAARAIDQEPSDPLTARIRALQTRQCIERACSETLDRFGRAFGPRPLAFDPELHRRLHEIQLYIRQCHAERDLQAIGAALRECSAAQRDRI
jgi:alkylation response protein AidB-like acyl-CoA dehydrogenase